MQARKILNGKDLRLGVCYYPEHWDKSLWREDLCRMKQAGLTVVRIGEFAWNLIESEEGVFTFDFFQEFLDLAKEEGMDVIYGTPTATPPAWLTERYPEVLNADREGHLFYHGARRHYNYNSEKYRFFCKRIVTEIASHYGKHPAIIGWQIDNELNCEVADFYSESDTEAFRRFLRKQYRDSIWELNEAWGTAFWNQTYNDFDQIYVPRHTIFATVNPHQVLDYYRFISDSACSFAAMQADILRTYKKPEDFITTNGIFPHLDNHRLTRESLDFITYDSYPNFPYCLDDFREEDKLRDRKWSRHLMETRSISPVFGIMEQQTGANGWNTRMEAPTPRPGQITLWTMQSIAHGADFVSFFRWRTARFGTEMYWHGILDYSGRENRRLAEIRKIGESLPALQPLAGSRYEAHVAVLNDYDNRFDSELDHWHGRLSEASEKGLFTALTLTHTPCDYVYLPEALEELKRYPVLIYPHPCIMTEERARILTDYVREGGTLIVGCRAGYKDERGQAVSEKLPGLLTELLGVDVPEYGLLPPEEPAPVSEPGGYEAAVFLDEAVPLGKEAEALEAWTAPSGERTPALIRHPFGKGETWYYASVFTEETVRKLLSRLHAAEPNGELIEAPEQVEIAVRVKGEERFLFALNYGRTEETVVLKKPMRALFTGEMQQGSVTLPKYGAMVWKEQ